MSDTTHGASTDTAIDAATLTPLAYEEAMTLQRHELDVTLQMLRELGEQDWTARTDCPAWDVRLMYLHVLGTCEGTAVGEMLHQMRAAMRHRRRHGGPLEAALSTVQVDERAELSPTELVRRLTLAAPKTIRRRRRLPGLVRRAQIKVDGPVVERWSLGYLNGTIYLRDMWMHRIDASRATGRELELTHDHDGRIVADVVGEWARRHGKPFKLTLAGPAGGTYASGDPAGIEPIRIDAVEFCRTLAGRAPATGLLTTIVPF